MLSKALKRLFRQQRPALSCELLGICDDYGLPSSHTQIVSFTCVIMLCLAWRTFALARHVDKGNLVLEALFLAGATVFTAYARVSLGYHSVAQVLLGFTVGAVLAVMLDQLLAGLAPRAGNRIQQASLARALGLQNNLWPCYYPAPNTRPPAAKKGRPSVRSHAR